MSVLALKLVLTPLFIAGASLAQRMWGSALAWLLAGLPWVSAPVLVFLALACVAGLIVLLGKPAVPTPARGVSWWDLPARMLVATALVLLISWGAGWLGPQWSGLLASLPVMSSVLGAFTHRCFGAHAAQALLRGVCVSAFGVLAFYVVVGSLPGRLGIALAYVVAACAALLVTAACRPLATGLKL